MVNEIIFPSFLGVGKSQKLRPFSTYLMIFKKEPKGLLCLQGILPTPQAWFAVSSLLCAHSVLWYRLNYCTAGFHACSGRQQPHE